MWVAIWLGVAAVSLVIEVMTFALVSIWFSIGGAVAAVLAAVRLPVWSQIMAFFAVSFLLFALLWRRLTHRKTVRTNSEALLGRRCVVTEEISNLQQTGRVAVDGLTWAAKNAAGDERIPVGAVVAVRRIEGVHLLCELVPEGTEET